MAKTYDIEITVISQKGTCGAGHKAGDKWIVSNHIPGGICLSAYPSMESSIDVLKYGGSFPWSKDPDDFSLDNPFGKPWVFYLVTEGDFIAFLQ